MYTMSRKSPVAPVVTLVLVTSIVGAMVSMFAVGHRQPSVILMAMFFVWVLSPYVALWLANVRAADWNPPPRRQLQYATVLISLAALGRYLWVLVWPVVHQPASTFMIVPFISWLVVAMVITLTERQARSA
jgi:hypothetical protein